MPTNILTTGTTAASSADQVIAAGNEVTFGIKGAAGPKPLNGSIINIELKDDAGLYFVQETLTRYNRSVILGVGTWRFTRQAGIACGVFSA